MKLKNLVVLAVLTMFSITSPAQRTEVDEGGSTKVESTTVPPQEAEKEAQKYFRKSSEDSPSSSRISSDDHYLALHLGAFVSSDVYSWGDAAHDSGNGRLSAGLTYRMAPLSALADWALRADFMGFELNEGRAVMLGLLPVIMFPESSSYFPLYFGFGAGPGIFFQQVHGESFLAVHYQLIAGARLFNLMGQTGFFIETGMKNHILLLSDGQFNGFFLTIGTIFTF